MDRRTREGNYNPGNYRPYGRVDKKSLAGAGIRILVKRNRRVFGSHRSGGQKEIRVWTRKSSSRYRAAVEKSATWKGQLSGLNAYSVESERGSQREAALSSKGYSASDERRILDAMGVVCSKSSQILSVSDVRALMFSRESLPTTCRSRKRRSAPATAISCNSNPPTERGAGKPYSGSPLVF